MPHKQTTVATKSHMLKGSLTVWTAYKGSDSAIKNICKDKKHTPKEKHSIQWNSNQRKQVIQQAGSRCSVIAYTKYIIKTMKQYKERHTGLT